MPSSALTQYQNVGLSGRMLERRASKQIHRARVGSSVEAARGNARIAAIRDVSQSALLAAGDLATIQSALVARTPTPEFAAQALYLTDTAVYAMADVIRSVAR